MNWRRVRYSPQYRDRNGTKIDKNRHFRKYKYLIMNNLENEKSEERISSSPQNEKEKTVSSSLERCFLFPVL